MGTTYHEEGLSAITQNVHRALASLQEELEAVDWYNQRADATDDAGLQALLIHNRNEEIEHASMLLEYLRRNEAAFDEQLKTYLFTDAPITEIEEADAEGATGEEQGGAGDGSLAIGNMK